MKKLLAVLLIVIMALFGLSACTNGNANGNNGNNGETSGNGIVGGNWNESVENGTTNPPVTTASDILIAYFSCTDTTEAIAKHIEAETKGALHEIIPEVPYTADDLKYYTNGRADKEQADSTARPAISGSVNDMEKYDFVFLGYPIWHGQAPKIIYTFLESYDFSGKTVIPFCTSHSSGIGSSDTNLYSLASNAEWVSGGRFASGTSQKTVAEWIDSLDLKFTPDVSSFDLANAKTAMRLP